MQKIAALKNKFKELGFKTIWNTFFKEEWDSLIISFLVLGVSLISLYIIDLNNIVLPHWTDMWGIYAIFLVLGYSGQRLAYKYLTTAEKALDRKIEEINTPAE